VLDFVQLPFMQRAALELALLAPLAGILGAQIVLRGLAFYAHGVGTAAFPGLVVASATGVPAPAAALGTGLLFAGLTDGLRGPRLAADAATALALVGALAIGVVLASDVFAVGAEVDQMLFGSLLAIGADELVGTLAALAVVACLAAVFRRDWAVTAFDPAHAGSLGIRRAGDWTLLLAIAVAVVAALDAAGALLVSAVLVLPAATVRPFARSMRGLELAAGALALVQGLLGLWLAYELNLPPGAAIALVGGAAFTASLALVEVSRLRGGAGPEGA
jgi:manganese/iron transport system permease protein